MTRVIITLIFLCILNFAQAQQGACFSGLSDKGKYEDQLTGVMFSKALPVKGEQFYNTSWDTGCVSLVNGKVINGKLIKYNGYTDELFWLRLPDYQQVIVDKYTVKEFTINRSFDHPKLLFRLIRIHNWYTMDSIDSYLQVLVEGKIKLYSLRQMKVEKDGNKLYPSYKYLIDSGDGKPSYFRPSRRHLVKLLADHKSEVRAILRKESLHVRQEGQLISAIQLINKAGF
jgi:hypothetical protein